MNVDQLLKRKPVRIAVVSASILFSAWCIHGFIDMVRQTHTRAVQREFSAAVDELEKNPPGIERAQAFLKRLKAIDPGYAPAEVKTALRDYISAMEEGTEAIQAGRDTSKYDAAAAEARERLIAGIKKYD